MRVPKVGEKWKRWDGKSNNITVTQVHQDALNPAATKIRYLYDDGYPSEKFLPEFHKKFRDPQEQTQCKEVHPPTGLRCVGMTNHDGPHLNGLHEWTAAQYKPKTKVVLSKPMESSKSAVLDSLQTPRGREHVKAYYGYDPTEANAFMQKQGNWDDPDYRARYNGFKK